MRRAAAGGHALVEVESCYTVMNGELRILVAVLVGVRVILSCDRSLGGRSHAGQADGVGGWLIVIAATTSR